MAEYGKIYKKLWTNLRFRAMSEDGRQLLLYLYSSPQSTVTGFYRLPTGYASSDLQWTEERLRKGIEETFGKGFIKYDQKYELVLILNWFGDINDGPNWHKIDSANVLKKALAELSEIPYKSPLVNEFVEYVKGFENPFVKDLAKPFERNHQSLPNSEAEAETEAEYNISPKRKRSATPTPTQTNPAIKVGIDYYFDLWKAKYGEKYVVGAKDAKAVQSLLKDLSLDDLQRCMRLFLADESPRLVEAKHPLTWLLSSVNKYVAEKEENPYAETERLFNGMRPAE